MGRSLARPGTDTERANLCSRQRRWSGIQRLTARFTKPGLSQVAKSARSELLLRSPEGTKQESKHHRSVGEWIAAVVVGG